MDNFKEYLEDDTRSNKWFKRVFASDRDRIWFQRPFPLELPSLSAAADNCDAKSTRVLEEVFNIFSRTNILELLAPGDIAKEQLLEIASKILSNKYTTWKNSFLVDKFLTQSFYPLQLMPRPWAVQPPSPKQLSWWYRE